MYVYAFALLFSHFIIFTKGLGFFIYFGILIYFSIFIFIHGLLITLHLQLLQNIGCITPKFQSVRFRFNLYTLLVLRFPFRCFFTLAYFGLLSYYSC